VIGSGRDVNGGAGRCPTVGAGIVSPAGVQKVVVKPPPDDHFTAAPHCRVIGPGRGRVGGAGSCPTVGAGIVSPAAVAITDAAVTKATPDDHFAAGPHCRVPVSGSGRAGGAGSCPRVVRARD
jgi:hypothetical protein